MNTVKAFLLCLIISLLTSCTGMITPTVLATQTLVPPTPEYTLTPSPTETPDPTATPEPTKTKSLDIVIEQATKIAKNAAEIPTSGFDMGDASPIDNQAAYQKLSNEVINPAFYKLMETYTGPAITRNETFYIYGEFAEMGKGSKIYPVMETKFKYNGEDVLMLIFAGVDNKGYFPIKMIVPQNPDWGNRNRSTQDQLLKLLPGEVDVKVMDSLYMSMDNYTEASTMQYYQTQFITDYYAIPENKGIFPYYSDWLFTGNFDREKASNMAFVFSTWMSTK